MREGHVVQRGACLRRFWRKRRRGRGAGSLVLLAVLAAITAAPWAGAQESNPRGCKVEPAGDSGSSEMTTWVVVIGVDSYEHVPEIRFCGADARLMADTLRRRGAEGHVHVLALTEDAEPHLQPTCENLLREIPEFLQRAGEQDAVILYFSGHGYHDPDLGTFLAPKDCRRGDLESTAVRLCDVRGYLEACKGELKVLVLDACHSGDDDEKGGDFGLTAKDIAPVMNNASNVYTLASCRSEEKSYIWDEKGHGLFTYWLHRGLQGAADGDGDAVIRADELYRFVKRHVVKTSERCFDRVQTPVRIVKPPEPRTNILRLQPDHATPSLERIAELLHEEAVSHGVKRIGVLELTNQLHGEESLRGTLGQFGKGAAGVVQEHLARFAQGRYAVADQRQVSRAVCDMAVDDLGDPERLGELSRDPYRMDALVIGSFLPIPGTDRLRLKCELLRLPGADVLGSVSGILYIDADLLSYAGYSGDTRPALSPMPDRPSAVECLLPSPRREEAAPPERHPLLDPEFPYRLSLWVNGKRRPLHEMDGGDLCVGVRKEEEYVIRLENRSEAYVLVQIFVDGLNVLGAKPELPDRARPWTFPPDTQLSLERWHSEAVSETDDTFRFKGGRFVVVDPSQSLAAKKGFGEDVGQITAIFYEAVAPEGGQLRGVGSDEGSDKKVVEHAKLHKEFVRGRMLAPLTIHYLDQDVLLTSH